MDNWFGKKLISELVAKQKAQEKKYSVLWFIFGGLVLLVVIAAAVYFIRKRLTPDYLEDFDEDDYEDELEDEEYYEDEETEESEEA